MKALRNTSVAFGLMLLGAAVGAFLADHFHSQTARAKETGEGPNAVEEKHEEKVKTEERAENNLTLGDETRERLEIVVDELHVIAFRPETTAFGVFEEDPASIFVLRAPIAGIVRLEESDEPFGLGGTLNAGDVIGHIEPRLGTIESLDLGSRLIQARAEVLEAAASLSAARTSYDQKKRLNEDSQFVSSRTLEESELRVKREEARLAAANDVGKQLEAVQTTRGVGSAAFPLRLARGGEIVESNCRDEEAVEAGQVLLKIAHYNRLIARIVVPVGETIDDAGREARIVPVGFEGNSIVAHRVAIGGSTGGRSDGRTLLYLIESGEVPLRPGLGVTAYLPSTKEPLTGVIIPRSAVVRFMGHSWVYMQMEEGQFIRRLIETKYATETGWFVESGMKEGEQIVVSRAALLLSEEAKTAIKQEEQSVQ